MLTHEIGHSALTAGVYINHLFPGLARLVVIGLRGETLCEVTGSARFVDILMAAGGVDRLTVAIDAYTAGTDTDHGPRGLDAVHLPNAHPAASWPRGD